MVGATGLVELEANGKPYKLWLGMSVLAKVQEEFGDEFDKLMSGEDNGQMPNLALVHAIFCGALQRYHAEEVDEYLVDDIIGQNAGALGTLMAKAMPTPEQGARARGKRKAAASR